MKPTLLLVLSFFLLSAATPKPLVYPNPAVDFISVSNEEGVAEMRIFNMGGRLMRSFSTQTGAKYSVSDLPTGVYLVQLLDFRGKILTTQRIQKR